MSKTTKIILQKLDPKASYIMLACMSQFADYPETKFILPKGMDGKKIVVYWVDDVEKAIRFVKIPRK